MLVPIAVLFGYLVLCDAEALISPDMTDLPQGVTRGCPAAELGGCDHFAALTA